jgi:hypothetical protein
MGLAGEWHQRAARPVDFPRAIGMTGFGIESKESFTS